MNFEYPQFLVRIQDLCCNFAIRVPAFSFISTLGRDSLRQSRQDAMLNGNHCDRGQPPPFQLQRHLLKDANGVSHKDRFWLQEFVVSVLKQKAGSSAKAIRRRRGIRVSMLGQSTGQPAMPLAFQNPPITPPCLGGAWGVKKMSDRTQTDTQATLRNFASALIQIEGEIQQDPDGGKPAPNNLLVGRVDEFKSPRKKPADSARIIPTPCAGAIRTPPSLGGAWGVKKLRKPPAILSHLLNTKRRLCFKTP
jgi:glycine cleavage system protein P-like pyridoxal-binding family